MKMAKGKPRIGKYSQSVKELRHPETNKILKSIWVRDKGEYRRNYVYKVYNSVSDYGQLKKSDLENINWNKTLGYRDDSDLDGLADNLSALEHVSGAVVITVDNDEKVRKYYLAPSQAQVIIPEIIEMGGTSSGVENNLPVYKLTPSQSMLIMKKFEEMNIPQANFENMKLEAPKSNLTLNTQNSTLLEDDVQDVIIVIESKDKIHKYVLTPVRAQSIIQQIIALSKETQVVTKGVSDIQEIKIPDGMVTVLITENGEEKHYILNNQDADEIKMKLQTENKVFESQANIVKMQTDTQNATQLEGLAEENLEVGHRIYYTGDMANNPSFGKISAVYGNEFGKFYDIEYENERFEGDTKISKRVPHIAFNKSIGQRFKTIEQYKEERQLQMDRLKASMAKHGIDEDISGLADKDPVVQKANEINRAMKKLFNSIAEFDEPYYYIALAKEYKKKGKVYESYYEPSWKKQKQSADPSHPAVTSVQESTVAGWLRRNFGLNFYKFKKNPVEEANAALGKKEKKAGTMKPEARSTKHEVESQKMTEEKEYEKLLKKQKAEKEEEKRAKEILDERDRKILEQKPETKDSDAELLAKILAKVEKL